MLVGAAEKMRRGAPGVIRQRLQASQYVDADKLRAEIIIFAASCLPRRIFQGEQARRHRLLFIRQALSAALVTGRAGHVILQIRRR